MEKVDLATADIAAENAAKLAELFPDIVTEVLDEDGNVRHSIDVEALKAHVGDIAEDKRERYQFTWPGKQRARAEAIRQIDKTMRPAPEESVNWDTTENLYIEGDNLDALKILRETYAGKIKMIYIDPPYNTGHDFVYNDSFARTAEEERAENGAFDEEGNVLDTAYNENKESNGRFHSDWCSMMYPRLVLARDLLSEDGVIFISIDDCEYTRLYTLVCNVFGSINLIATIVRNTNSSKNQSQFISVSHEYCIVAAKDLALLKASMGEEKWGVEKNNVREYMAKVKQLQKEGLSADEITEELKVLTKYPRFIDFTNYWYFDEKGLYQKADLGGVPNGNREPVVNRITGRPDPVPPGGFRFSRQKMEALADEGRIHFHTDGSLPRLKRYLAENMTQRPKSIMSDDQRPDVNMLKGFSTPFDNPKQMAFVERIASVVVNDAIVLDFFSGSATTAHAVMQLNVKDGGNRKFIMVQLPEASKEGSEAAKAGYKNICEIGKERIRRAGAKIAAEVEGSNAQLKPGEEPKKVPDIGFRVLKIDSSNFEDVKRTPDAIQQDQLSGLADNLKPNRTAEDILFQLFPQFQIPYTASVEKLDICGKTVYSVDGDALLACFDREVSEDVIRAMAEREPSRAVLRDASFVGDDALANFEEIFKTLSPETETKVV
ncbi:site-specific DNA-methyltransferase [Slackia piriformis]|uniref:DNA methylase N-4/N-6 domain-containing protein n=1 Tax=Slackia piriformis YIT 12062 TaxID=742818 RepID=K0Z8R6_9ACTN|nr:site-specific DNA-methyltransferase [Slackia piriformis]EJZ83770.1 hypothetical protein HMPREF9451_01291 [Slackia piriformis YIT 12062]